MIVAQANLGRGVTTDVYRRNLSWILGTFGARAVYCLQEIDEADKPDEMEILLSKTRDTHHIVGRRTAVPILVPHHLDLFSVHVEPACKGLALITPNRVVNEAVIQLRKDLQVAVLNTHLPRNVPPLTNGRRRDVREALTGRAIVHPAGVWVADTNTRKGWPAIRKAERTLIDAGIDKAKVWAPGGYRLVLGTHTRTVNLTIDGHNAHGRSVWWVKR